MKLVSTGNKAKITWIQLGYRAFDAKCDCGWESKTGGAIKASVTNSVNDHKFYDHNYKYELTEPKPNALVEGVKEMMNNNCPNCGTEMHTNTIIGKRPWKKYQECPNCNYNNRKEAMKK